MKLNAFLPATLAVFCLSAGLGKAAIVVINTGTLTQNFNTIGTTAAAGWDVRTGSTASALGTVSTYTTTAGTATAWADTSGAFKNFASATGQTSAAATATQTASTNRALGIRQSGSFGDPGASFNFNFSTTDVEITTISLDLQMLNVQPRTSTWTIQYGLGASPTSWTTLGTHAGSGTFGSTTVTYDEDDFGTALDDRANIWFRVVTLGASTGSGNRDSFAIDNFSIVAVPEPQAATLIGALGMIGILRRRR